MVKIRNIVRWILLQPFYLVNKYLYKMDISSSSRISLGAKIDKTFPSGIHIDEETYVASGAIIFSHDFSRSKYEDTYIGKRCFIGANAIIMSGVKIGNNCIVGSGSVVTKSVPNSCIVAGNPARIIRENIKTEKYGKIDESL